MEDGGKHKGKREKGEVGMGKRIFISLNSRAEVYFVKQRL